MDREEGDLPLQEEL
jgi:hypothetical protein